VSGKKSTPLIVATAVCFSSEGCVVDLDSCQIYQALVDVCLFISLGAALTSADAPQLQAVLEEVEIPKRLMLTLELLQERVFMWSILHIWHLKG